MISPITLTIIGTGPGAVAAALRARKLGIKVTILEQEHPLQRCQSWYEITFQALLKSAMKYENISKCGAYGLKAEGIHFDLDAIMERSQGITDRFISGIEFLFKKHKIKHRRGEACFLSPGEILLRSRKGETSLRSDFFIIATGARPRTLPDASLDGERIISPQDALRLQTFPQRVVIVGAGSTGMEWTCWFRALGAQVTLLETQDQILPHEDSEIARTIRKILLRKGIQITTSAAVTAVSRIGEEVEVEFEYRGQKKRIRADAALMAVGVTPELENLGLERSGVRTSPNGIIVNQHMQTQLQHIYAIGDAIGPPWLAHAAAAEGIHAVEHLAGRNPDIIDYDSIPYCLNCRPPLARLGLTEQRAQTEGIGYTVGRFDLRANSRALATGEADGLVKLLFDQQYGTLIGAHIVGGAASEMIHELVLGKRLEVTAEEIARSIHAHPSLSESIMEAARISIGAGIYGA